MEYTAGRGTTALGIIGTVLGGTPFAMTVPIWAPVEIFLEPTGAFLILGFVAALARALRERKKQSVRKEETS